MPTPFWAVLDSFCGRAVRRSLLRASGVMACVVCIWGIGDHVYTRGEVQASFGRPNSEIGKTKRRYGVSCLPDVGGDTWTGERPVQVRWPGEVAR
ncbi:hypothetical protein GCM10027456_56720 [Kineosporia babensis]